MPAPESVTVVTPHLELDRAAWRRLGGRTPLDLDAAELEALRGRGEDIDLVEVADVYLPLSRLLHLGVAATHRRRADTAAFLGTTLSPTPYVVGITGSVAVGKSTTARVLQAVLAGWPDQPEVALVTTDGFLFPNAELARRGVLHRKGFPESYDQDALLRFLAGVKAGVDEVEVPVYSHLVYDIVPGEQHVLRQPDILIVEGLNLLQLPAPAGDGRRELAVSDFIDFSVYVDARASDIRRWFVNRFLALRDTAFRDDRSYFRRFATLDHDEAVATAERIWDEINGPNLVEHILPIRDRATLVLHKDRNHRLTGVRLRAP